jgi:uncharacterized protein YndB with AHSA1/START domain
MPSVDSKVVEREIKVNAAPETVFSYLVEEAKLRRWMSMGGRWAPRPGEAFRLEMNKEDVAAGKYVEVKAPSRVVFTWGWEGDDAITKPGSSTVEITLTPDGAGTIVKLVHRDLPTPESAESHAHGWEHYLQRLSVAATGADPGPDKFQE